MTVALRVWVLAFFLFSYMLYYLWISIGFLVDHCPFRLLTICKCRETVHYFCREWFCARWKVNDN